MKSPAAVLIASILASSAFAADPIPALPPSQAPAPAPAPTCSIVLGPRTACATPSTTRQARADGGFIDVTTPSPNVLAMSMSGSVAANAFLGHTSAATETFHLEQEFDIECTDPDAEPTGLRLTVESALAGFIRAKHRAGAGVRMASAKVCVAGSPETPLVVVHPPQQVSGEEGRLCNQHLPLIRVDRMPPGKYILVADFVLSCQAGGIADGHSAADFSPSTALPADWVRTRDPFQGVDKKDFGFKVVLTVELPEKDKPVAAVAPRRDLGLARTSAKPAKPAAAVVARPLVGLDRHSGPR
jgi:hypothetical protein